MHELGVVFHVIKMVEEVARENDLTQVESVTLELGEVSGVIDSYLENCWNWAVKKQEKLLRGAELKLETIPAVTYCEDCQNLYGTIEHGKICPRCKSPHTYLQQGNEFRIKEISAC